MFTDESSYTKCLYYICIVNDLLYEMGKIKEMKVTKKNIRISFKSLLQSKSSFLPRNSMKINTISSLMIEIQL